MERSESGIHLSAGRLKRREGGGLGQDQGLSLKAGDYLFPGPLLKESKF